MKRVLSKFIFKFVVLQLVISIYGSKERIVLIVEWSTCFILYCKFSFY